MQGREGQEWERHCTGGQDREGQGRKKQVRACEGRGNQTGLFKEEKGRTGQ